MPKWHHRAVFLKNLHLVPDWRPNSNVSNKPRDTDLGRDQGAVL